MAERKIKSIGLALSGGGYRAAGFHLGAMDMLGRLQLLDRVKGMSTVSGGTIAGAYYALEQSRGKRPEEIIPAFASWLVRTDVIDRALKEHPAATRKARSRRRDLITNASEVYNELLGGAQFGELFENSGHLDDVIFNA
ncbi:MAG TPA: patatin-like phospholipase family protein, partial [Myxococcaceae bacterium]